MLTTICIPVSATSEQATLIYSNSFESKESNGFSGSMRVFTYSEDYARTGKVSINAVGSEAQSGGWLWVQNDATFKKGKTYTVRFFAMSEDKNASVSSQMFISGSKSISSSDASKAIPIGSWGEHVTQFNWDDDATAASLLFKFGGEGNIYIDDIEIYEGAYQKTVTPDTETPFRDIVAGSAAINVYVDVNAATNGGGSLNDPFNSIEAARDYVRKINEDMSQNIVVNLMSGTYMVEETILLTDEDSGSNGYYVIYQPYNYGRANQAQVTLSGGKPVTEWTLSEKSGVYKATLSVDYVRNLYVNGTRAQRARYNEYVTPISWWDDTDNNLSTKDGFVIPGGIITNPEKATNLEIYRTAAFRSNWAVKGKAIANGDTTILAMEQPYFYMHELANYSVLEWKIENNFRLENALEFLDEPGEWYHDKDTKTLYYMPRANETIEDCDVIAPDTEQILNISGSSMDNRAENIIVRGLTFSHGADKKTSRVGRANLQSTLVYSVDAGNSSAAPSGYAGSQLTAEGNINILNAKNVSVSDNTISHMGGVAIAMPVGIENCEIKGNAVYDISSSAITVGSSRHEYVTDTAIVPKNILITNNVIGKTGVEYGSDPAVQGYYTNGLMVSHNEVYDAAYSGICVGWGWTNAQKNTQKNNTIEYNRIYNYGKECQDGGGIYTLGNQPDSVVRGNYILSYEQDIVGLYHDEGSSGFTSTGNVIDIPADSASSGLYDHSGHDDLCITDNYTNVVNTTDGKSDFCDNFTEQGATRSVSALLIRENAGLTDAYKSVRNKISDYSDNTSIKRIYLQTEEQKHHTPANITVGESLTLKTLAEKINGEISTIDTGLTYSVGDTSVLDVNGNQITAKANGISNVCVTDSEGNTAFMTVTVGDEVVSLEVMANSESVKVDETINVIYRLKTKYTEFVASPKKSEISATSGIFSVVTDGTVKALSEGIGTISVSVQCGEFLADSSVSVTVTDNTYRTFKKTKLNGALETSDILDAFDKDESETITEKEFVDVFAIITQTASDKICTNPADAALTKEKMVAIAADVVVNLYGRAPMGDSELHQYTDRAKISPSLIPKIALAYEYGLLSWLEESTAFEPEKEITTAEATEFLYYFARPEKREYFRMDETRFSTYKSVREWLTTRSYPEKHAMANQRNFEKFNEECIEIANTVHNGTGSVAIQSGELVQKISRSTAYSDVTIVLLNKIDFKPGKNYNLSFKAKVSPNSTTSGTATGKNNLSVSPQFTVTGETTGIPATPINSNTWTGFSLDIGIPEDATYPIEKNTIYIRFRNTSALDTSKYDVLLKDIMVTEEADIGIISSTIADGEKDVHTPIDSIYIYTSGAVDEDTVSIENFAIEGIGANVTDVSVINEKTIRIGIDGCIPETDYTLTISDIKGKDGGLLNDSISWSTADAVSKKTGKWDFENSYKDGVSGDSGISGVKVTEDNSYSGTKSVEITTANHANVYINGKKSGLTTFEVGKKYLISYRMYSPKAIRTGMYKLNGDRFIDLVKIPANEWVRLTGVFCPTAESQLANDVFMMQVYDNPGVCYIDDIRITEIVQNPVTVHRPNIFKDGIPVSSIDEGDFTVEIKITGGETSCDIWSVLAQYSKNRMSKMLYSDFTVNAKEEKTVTIELSDMKAIKTKLLILNKTTMAPYCEAIEIKK